MVGEVGELCECFQWKGEVTKKDIETTWSDSEREHLGEELSDVLIYLVRLAGEFLVVLIIRISYLLKHP